MRYAALLAVAAAFAANTRSKPDDWAHWRGPEGTGVARGDAPLKWSPTENVAWKIAIPGKGHSSPVVWGDKIFLTTAVPIGPIPAEGAAPPPPPPPPPPPDGGRKGPGKGGFAKKGGGMRPGGLLVDHEFTVLAFNRKDGKLLWKQVAVVEKPHEGYHARYGSYASNSPVTDGKRLYVSFGSRGVFCYDLNGKLLWKRDAPFKMKMRLQFGEGSPITLEGDTLLLNFDEHGGNSMIWAIDAANGKDRWRTPRDEISSWSAPFVVKHEGRKQVILTGEKRIRSYDFKTGKLIWECGGLGANPIPMPVAIDGMVLVMSGYVNPNLLAIKLGRDGDLTGTDAIVWTNQRGNSYTPSPVLADGKLYMLTDSGMLSCLDAKSGKPHYAQQRLPKSYNFKSSLVAANGRLYMASENEDVVVVKMGEQFEVLATNTMTDESFIATPAVVGGDLYLRSEKNLYCIRAAR